MKTWLEEILAVSIGLLLRSMTSVHPHSGQGIPPKFGDYEAQRHWQEITVNLPVTDWYFNTTDNDLMYWGLDYPPLTAYHSYLVGKVAEFQNPSWIELHNSRGTEDYHHKIFMRNSVLIADFLILSPAILAFTRVLKPENNIWSLATFMLYPGLILIDNGHFQYNNISLGLFTLAVALILQNRELCASVAFVLALNYKQMELYHALPFFFYLLGLCFGQKSWISAFSKLCKIGLTVIVTFGLVWWPFIQNHEQIVQVIHRIFPVNRGLFEDKVANFWCSLNVIYKLRTFDQDTLVLISGLVTLMTALPANLALFWRPSKDQFILALFNTSMSFFLFSYHVHEKSILLVAFPAMMAYKAIQGHRYSNFTITWFLIVSTFSMWPLLLKDGLALATLALQGIFVTIAHYISLLDFGAKNEGQNVKRTSPKPLTNKDLIKGHVQDWTVWTLFNLSVIGYGAMMLASVYLLPPPKYPDLWPLLISVYSAGHFVVFWIYFSYCQFKAFRNIKVTPQKKTN